MMLDKNAKIGQQVDRNNRVLILVRGGVAEAFADESVQVFLLDYDNEPDRSIPDKFIDLLTLHR